MIHSIISFSVNNKLIIGLFALGLIVTGMWAMQKLPIDAVPDITNNQVQVVTTSGSLAAQEMEQLITYPIEVVMANIPGVSEIRSISRFGLSVVTIVFEDHIPVLEARQFVKEQASLAEEEIPEGLGTPELMPITTGLGEIYQYILKVEPAFREEFGAMELRTIQDWIVKRQLAGITGIIEVSSFGGYLKQYEVAVDPMRLNSLGLSLNDVFEALERNNQNSGGSYIEKQTNAYYIRTEGVVKSLDEIEQICIRHSPGASPIFITDVADVRFGHPKRFGAMTMDGEGEAVGGITLMLKGGNSSEAIKNVQDRIEKVQRSLPKGVSIEPYLDRSDLVAKTINTVKTNLLEGGVIVIIVLIILLGDLRAGLVVASVIPLALLFALIMMYLFNVSANLMSLGAIDFGIVVDGAVIIIEGVLHALTAFYVGKTLTQDQMSKAVIKSSSALFRSAFFGVLIILVVFIPIMTLEGIEGRMFRPMALTFSFAVLGALILSLTYVPMMASLVFRKQIEYKQNISNRLVGFFKRLYQPVLRGSLRIPYLTIGVAVGLFFSAVMLFRSMGAEFIPTLEEGDLAMQMAIQPGSSLEESIRTTTKAEKVLKANFPEVKHVVSKIGTAEVPTDPMAIEDADIMIILKDKKHWVSAETREGLVEKMKASLSVIIGASFEFTQPIQLRFNELMTGAKADIAVKIFGENNEQLSLLANQAERIIKKIEGAGDVKVEQTEGLPQLMVRYNRQQLALHGLDVESINKIIRTAYAGEAVGVVFENERKFDLVVRLSPEYRKELNLQQLQIQSPNGGSVPLSTLAEIDYSEGPMQISREDAKRLITIGVNVRGRDVASLVSDIETEIGRQLPLPPGYSIRYGGQFENLQAAQRRLSLAVPLALFLIFLLLFFAFGKFRYAIIIFTAVPLSAIGGILALWLRGMPFSISAGIGFIALFGVAVLNGIVLLSQFNQLKQQEQFNDFKELIIQGGLTRLRPVIMTATVAALGFLPMALSTSNGAEVQKPLATVVIGGLITATLLTLLVLPVLYYLVDRKAWQKGRSVMLVILVLLFPILGQAQKGVSLDSLLSSVQANHPLLKNAALEMQAQDLEKEAIGALPPTSLGLQSGQINTALYDFNLFFDQTLNVGGKVQQARRVVGAEKAFNQAALIVQRKELRYQVKKHWDEWKFQVNRVRIADAQFMLLDSIAKLMEFRWKNGYASKLEYVVAQNQKSRAFITLQSEESTMESLKTALLSAAFVENTVPLEDSTAYLKLDFPENLALSESFLQPYRQSLKVKEEKIKLSQKSSLPEFSVGYFAQSIRPDIPFQGVNVGMEIPLDKKGIKRNIQIAELQLSQAQNLYVLANNKWSAALSIAQQKLFRLQEQVAEKGQPMLESANEMKQLAQLQLENGEIDFFQYTQSLQVAFESELYYLKLLHDYNQAVLYYQFLTE